MNWQLIITQTLSSAFGVQAIYFAIAALDAEQLALVFAAWQDRTARLEELDGIRCVFVFENRGADVGVTLQQGVKAAQLIGGYYEGNTSLGVFITLGATNVTIKGDIVGGINRFFHYLYKLRLHAKGLKARSRGVYYAGKWLLIGGLLWALFW